jgi:hypothetical protein
MIRYLSTSTCRIDSNINNTIIKTLRAQLFLRDTRNEPLTLAGPTLLLHGALGLAGPCAPPLCRSGHSTRASLALRADAAVHSDDSERGGACSVSRKARLACCSAQQQSYPAIMPDGSRDEQNSQETYSVRHCQRWRGRAQVCNAQTGMTTTGGLGARSQDPAGGAGYPDTHADTDRRLTDCVESTLLSLHGTQRRLGTRARVAHRPDRPSSSC